MTLFEPAIAAASAELRQQRQFPFTRCQCCPLPDPVDIALNADICMVIEQCGYGAARLSFATSAGAPISDIPAGLVVLEIISLGNDPAASTPMGPMLGDNSAFALCHLADYNIVFGGATVLQIREQRAWTLYKRG